MTINGHEITAKEFAFDGCHKIYLMNTAEDKKVFTEYGYDFYPIENLQEVYETSCMLKFISNGDLENSPVEQGEEAIFA